MIPKDFNEAHAEVIKLVQTFADNLAKYQAPDYNESAARKDFIDKFFTMLGWDVNHDHQTNPYEQEVKVERNVNVAARVKKADYAFFLKPNFGAERFFVEAKRPSANLDTPDNCFQTIRYAFSSSRAALSILTNFKEFYVIDCRFRPDIGTAVNHIHKKYYFTDFLDFEKFAEIYYLFGREAVHEGSLEKYAATLPKPRGRVRQRRLVADSYQEIDEAFLAKLEEYREDLAKMFKRKNDQLTSEDLTEAVQRTLDRLVFIRFLEDKLIEPSTILDKFGAKPHAWAQFIAKCREFDKSYNGIIFKPNPIIDSPAFVVDDAVFLAVCNDFADKYTPYHFNYIPIHILGSIYERFLGNVIVATAKRATVEAKPEVRKAGGVFYTPQYIVNYIVENTVGKLLNPSGSPPYEGGVAAASADGVVLSSPAKRSAKADTLTAVTPADVAKMRFADIACGSGSFLLGVYDYLLRWHTKYYNSPKGKKEAKKDGCITNDDGTFHLSFEQKREILVNNIYGVDIDRQAYEVTQLSLFLKLLEEETIGTKQQFLTGHRESMLPSLADNIVCGNALVDWDISSGDLFESLDADKERKLNSMSFKDKFPKIMANGGFDAIVGNPPYVLGRETFDDTIKKYLATQFQSYGGKFDLYVYFTERSIGLLKPRRARLGYIIPNTILANVNAAKLRKHILETTAVKIVRVFEKRVFDAAQVESVVIVIEKGETDASGNVLVDGAMPFEIQQSSFLKNPAYKFNVNTDASGSELLTKLRANSLELGELTDICIGIQLGGSRGKSYKDSFITTEPTNATFKKVLDGKDIGSYLTRWGGKYVRYGNWLHRKRDEKYFLNPKVIIRQIGSVPVATFDEEKYYTLNTIYNLISKDAVQLKYCLAIINSRLGKWFWKKENSDFKDIFPKIKKQQIESVPIHVISSDNFAEKAMHDAIVRSVEQIMEAKQKLAAATNERDVEFWTNKCNMLEKSIDETIYKLYDLTPDEIKLVEGA